MRDFQKTPTRYKIDMPTRVLHKFYPNARYLAAYLRFVTLVVEGACIARAIARLESWALFQGYTLQHVYALML